MTSKALSLSVLTVGALALAGCASAEPAADGTVQVVASTSVYGQIVEEIGGEHVTVTSIVTSDAQDPHGFEPSARDQLTVSRADLLIENGGGYDAFLDALIESSGVDVPVITAVEHSHDWPDNDGHAEESAQHDEADHADGGHDVAEHDDADHDDDHDGHDHGDHGHVEGFNEHVWYDPHTIAHLAEDIAEELAEIDPDHRDDYLAGAERFVSGITEVEAALAEIEKAHGGQAAFVTEPVPGYLLGAAGLRDLTPSAFSEAVEEGQDVPPATLLEAERILSAGDVRVLIVNAQTGGAETDTAIGYAEKSGIPVLEFAETLPKGQTYLSWMTQNVQALADALTA